MAIYHINNQLAAFGDIQTTYGFNVILYPPSGIENASAFSDTGIIFSMVREVNIPGRSNQPIESFFHGMKQKFPGKEEFSGSFSINVEETANLDGLKALYEWKQKCFNVNQGVSNTLLKSGLVGTAIVQFLGRDEQAKSTSIKVWNVWPKDMPDISMSYENSASVKYQVTFEYDYWTLEGDTTVNTGVTY